MNSKREFIKKLAKYLAWNSAIRSVGIEAERRTKEQLKGNPLAKLVHPWAAEWAEVRAASPVGGWVTEQEAEKQLLVFFGLED